MEEKRLSDRDGDTKEAERSRKKSEMDLTADLQVFHCSLCVTDFKGDKELLKLHISHKDTDRHTFPWNMNIQSFMQSQAMLFNFSI